MKILIVGGVAGGATAAARLRRLSEDNEIIMFERGDHISFANCGLPYYVGGVIGNESDLLLQTPESFSARFNVQVRTHHDVILALPRVRAAAHHSFPNTRRDCLYHEQVFAFCPAKQI